MYSGAMSNEQRAEGTGAFLVPIDPFFPVYDNMIGKIGVLTPAEVSALLRAYSFLMLSPKNLTIIGNLRRDEFSAFVEVPVKYKAILANMTDRIVEVLDEALLLLDR